MGRWCRAGGPIRAIDRWLDGAVILGALYLMAMYKFVADKFALGDSVLFFPSFLKYRWVAIAFTVGYAVFFVFYVARTLGDELEGHEAQVALVEDSAARAAAAPVMRAPPEPCAEAELVGGTTGVMPVVVSEYTYLRSYWIYRTSIYRISIYLD